MIRDTTTAPILPGGSGFTLLFGPDSSGTGRQWLYYKFATGSESGSLALTVAGSQLKLGRMYTFRNVASSSFTEDGGFGFDSSSSTTVLAHSVTTTGPNRLAVSFVFDTLDGSIADFTGESGGDWTEATGEYKASDDGKGGIQLQTETMTSAGTISGGSSTLGHAASWGVRAFALISTIAGYPTGNVEFQVLPPGGSWTTFDTEALLSGSATSASYTPGGPGVYYFRAIYLGDANHIGSQSGDTDEPLLVTFNVIPEAPLGTILVSVAMLLALSCAVVVKRRKKT